MFRLLCSYTLSMPDRPDMRLGIAVHSVMVALNMAGRTSRSRHMH